MSYSLPHLINRRAIVAALRQEGVTKIVGFGSVGGLKEEFGPGTVSICDDYFQLWTPMCLNNDASAHIGPSRHARQEYVGRLLTNALQALSSPLLLAVPSYDEELRQEIIALLKANDIAFKPVGTDARLSPPIPKEKGRN